MRTKTWRASLIYIKRSRGREIRENVYDLIATLFKNLVAPRKSGSKITMQNLHNSLKIIRLDCCIINDRLHDRFINILQPVPLKVKFFEKSNNAAAILLQYYFYLLTWAAPQINFFLIFSILHGAKIILFFITPLNANKPSDIFYLHYSFLWLKFMRRMKS